jgi:hypothetical protein
MNRRFIIVAALFIMGCNDNTKTKEQEQSKASELIGEWSNTYLRIDIASKRNGDVDEVLEVDRAHWEEKLKIKPIRTFFRADSTWNSAYYNLNDSLLNNSTGKWWIESDTLVFAQEFPNYDTTKYAFTIKGDTASFQAMLDWDGDGQKDDKYLGTQIKKPANK